MQRRAKYLVELDRFNRIEFIEKNGRRYSVTALLAILMVLRGNLETICYRYGRKPKRVRRKSDR